MSLTDKSRKLVGCYDLTPGEEVSRDLVFALALDVVAVVARTHGTHRSLENCPTCHAVDAFRRMERGLP